MSRDSIRARVEAATEGPWTDEEFDLGYFVVQPGADGDVVFGDTRYNMRPDRTDAAFVANARQDIPTLLRLADAVAELMCHEVGWNGESPFWVYTGSPASLLRTMRDALADLEALP